MNTSNINFNRLQTLTVEQQEIATPLLLHLYGLRKLRQATNPFELIPVGDDDTAIVAGHEIYYYGSQLNPADYNERTLLDFSLVVADVFEVGTPLYDYFQNLFSDTPTARFLKTAKQIADLGSDSWR